MTEAAYPYTSEYGVGATCQYVQGQGIINTVVNSNGAYYISAQTPVTEQTVKDAIDVKPSSIAVHSASSAF